MRLIDQRMKMYLTDIVNTYEETIIPITVVQ